MIYTRRKFSPGFYILDLNLTSYPAANYYLKEPLKGPGFFSGRAGFEKYILQITNLWFTFHQSGKRNVEHGIAGIFIKLVPYLHFRPAESTCLIHVSRNSGSFHLAGTRPGIHPVKD